MEDKVLKEKLHKIDFLYIASMVMFVLSYLVLRTNMFNPNWDGGTSYSNLWFEAIAVYSIASIVCYILGIVKINNYNKKDSVNDIDYKYKINHFFGFFNFIMVFLLDFGLLVMILTSGYIEGNYLSFFLLLGISLFFLVSFILRSTILKKTDQMGLRCFDANSFLFYLYGAFMMLLNVLKVEYNNHWLVILVGINFIITNINVYYPIKAMVFAKDKKLYNPFKTVYIFIRRLISLRVFFFIGLLFNLIIGGVYLIGAAYYEHESWLNIYLIIAAFYFGLAFFRFFTFFWKRKNDKSNASDLEKYNVQCKITLFNAISTFVLTILLSGLLFYIFNDLKGKNASWFIFIQGGFITFRLVFLINEIIKANKSKNPYNIALVEGSALSMSVMIFSLVLSLNLFFDLEKYYKAVSISLVFIIISSGIGATIHLSILGILGLKGKLKRFNDIEDEDI